jgi:hypothetical protein
MRFNPDEIAHFLKLAQIGERQSCFRACFGRSGEE